MKLKKTFIAIAVLASAALLSGCAYVTYDEAQASDKRFVEIDSGFWSKRQWVFIDQSGVEQPTFDCKDRSFWDSYCVETEGGTARLEWSEYKGNIRHTNVFYQGIKYSADCASKGFKRDKHICVKFPSDQ